VWKVKDDETTNDLFAFPTTDPHEEVGAIHPKAMEIERWMTVPTEEALKLLLPDGSLKIVARG
jgi:putative SOS response-associated peptidase YedK